MPLFMAGGFLAGFSLVYALSAAYPLVSAAVEAVIGR